MVRLPVAQFLQEDQPVRFWLCPNGVKNWTQPDLKPLINSHPCDSGGCHSVTQTCPNASESHPVLLRYERGKRLKVKKTNRLRFRLCPNGVKNQTQPDLKPLINSHPCDSGGCHSVMWVCPNVSEARSMLLRCERRKEWKVDIWKVIGL
jgi:hypothetical protein